MASSRTLSRLTTTVRVPGKAGQRPRSYTPDDIEAFEAEVDKETIASLTERGVYVPARGAASGSKAQQDGGGSASTDTGDGASQTGDAAGSPTSPGNPSAPATTPRKAAARKGSGRKSGARKGGH